MPMHSTTHFQLGQLTLELPLGYLGAGLVGLAVVLRYTAGWTAGLALYQKALLGALLGAVLICLYIGVGLEGKALMAVVPLLAPRHWVKNVGDSVPNGRGPRQPMMPPGTTDPGAIAQYWGVPTRNVVYVSDLEAAQFSQLAVFNGMSAVYLMVHTLSGEGYVGFTAGQAVGALAERIEEHTGACFPLQHSDYVYRLLKAGTVLPKDLVVVVLETYPVPWRERLRWPPTRRRSPF